MAITRTLITSEQQWHELRARNVGCSEVGALLGAHEYLTAYALAARKLGKLPKIEDNPALKRGRLLEPIAKQLLAELKPDWQQIEPEMSAYYSDDEIRFGATPDQLVRDAERRLGVVQFKTVTAHDFVTKWRTPTGELQPPLWIAMQVMGEQHLTGADFAIIAVLVIGHGLELHLIEVPYLQPVVDRMRAAVVAFWEMVDRGELPDPDYGRDGAALIEMLREDDGSELDLTQDNELPDIVATIDALRGARSTAQEGINEAQAKLLHRIGAARRIRFAGGVITASTVHRKEYVVEASSYRKISFRFDRGKEKCA